jgi:4-hydroxy-2-oxoheptanedioate aldolase
VLRGATVFSCSTALAELAGKIGFDAVWIDMEHGPAGFWEVANLCLAVEAGGAIPVVRVPDAQRCHILRALEVGARMVVVPMVNSMEEARQVVAHGRFAPVGRRGLNTRTRGMGFGLQPVRSAMAAADARIELLAQVETREAVQRVDDICGVDGLSGILVGPADLSVDMGIAGEFDNPELLSAVVGCVKRAKLAGKRCGILVAPGPLLDAALDAGCNLAFIGGDVSDLSRCWRELLQRVTCGIARTSDRNIPGGAPVSPGGGDKHGTGTNH